VAGADVVVVAGVEVEAPPNRLEPAAGAFAGSAGFAPNNPPPVVLAGASAGLAAAAPNENPALGASSFFSPSFASAGLAAAAPKLPNIPPAFGASAAGADVGAGAGAVGVEVPLPPNENPVLGVSAFGASAGLVVAAGVEPKEAKEKPPVFGDSAAG